MGVGTSQSQVPNWDGSVEVRPRDLTIEPGKAIQYELRLTASPGVDLTNDDKWWVMIWVDGQKRPDVHEEGGYKGLTWTPSLGWEFDKNNWDRWRTVQITASEDAEPGASIKFNHEVWDHNSNCPVHEVGDVGVTVVAVSPPPTLSIGNATVEEGEVAKFEVTLSGASSETVWVDYATSGGTAVEGSDYTRSSGTLMFAAGTTARTVRVQTTDDTDPEPTGKFTVVLSGPVNATVQTGTGTGTITDNDAAPPPPPPPEVSIGDARVDEGGTAAFEVRLSVASAWAVTVGYATKDGTALAGTDYTMTSGTLTFDAETTVKTVEVRTTEDELDELDEVFTVELSGPSGAVLGDGTGVGTIGDDEAAPEASIGDARVDEGGTAEFEVTLSGASDRAVTVEYRTVAGTALAGTDYTAATGTLTFLAGSRREVIAVATIEDELAESDEGFTVELRAPSGATLRGDTGTGTIVDDDTDTGTGDALPELSIADATAEEGETVELSVTLSKASADVVTVEYRTVAGTALAGTDYTAAAGTLTFEAGERRATIAVATIEDELAESDEGFTVELRAPSGATLRHDTGTGTIVDDDTDAGTGDALPELSIADATAEEGETVELSVTLSKASAGAVTVEYRTVAGTALAGTDYTAASGTLTFEAGERRATIEVATIEDEVAELDETFTVELSGPSGAVLGDRTGVGTIADDEAAPEVSIGDARVDEGGTAAFEVRLSVASAWAVTVGYATKDGTALAGTDYTMTSGTLTFDAGTTVKTVEVRTTEDELDELDEVFTVELSGPSGAVLGDGTGVGTIGDDEAAPEASIGDARVDEGGTAEFEVTLSGASDRAVTVEYRTVAGTALAGTDYTAATGTLTFLAGSRREVIAVATIEDELAESDEGFTVELRAPSGATLRGDTGTGTIIDDDTDTGTGDALPELSIADATAEEGETVELSVTLSKASAGAVTVEYRTVAGTALAGTDYTAATGTLTFLAGSRREVIAVATIEDELAESDEGFTVELRAPSGATLRGDTGTGTIVDDDTDAGTGDALPELSIADATAEEGETVELSVTLSKASAGAVTVEYRTVAGTALAGTDYTAAAGTLTFEAGERRATIEVATIEDEVAELDETFTVELSGPSGGVLGDRTGVGTIADDEAAPEVSIGDARVDEGGTAAFEVRLSVASAWAVTVGYATKDGTALAGADYTMTSGTLTFDAGTTVKTVEVRTTEDELDELDEVFTVELSGPSGAVLGDGTGVGTIGDDEAAPEASIGDARVDEGGTAEFEVTLSGASDRAVTVEYRTVAGTALAGTDYTAAAGTLTFLAGSRREVIAVATIEDELAESDEGFTVELRAPSGATLRGDTGTGTIVDDDTDAGTGDTLPELSIADATAEEGETVELSVTLSKASAGAVTVEYRTVAGTALAGTDYTAATGTLTFLAGSRREVIAVATIEDELAESDEGFTVELRAPSGATLRGDTGTGTIIDDDTDAGTGDALPELSIADATAEEGETVELSVTLSKASAGAVTVEYRTVAGTALAGTDYTAAAGTLTFEAGERRATIEVATIEDEVAELDETFTVELSGPSGGVLGDGAGKATIIDDDGGTGTTPEETLPEMLIADATVEEGETVELSVTLSKASAGAVTVEYRTVAGTALAGTDYTAATGTLTFLAGSLREVIAVATIEDQEGEADETFTVELSAASGAVLGDSTGKGTITDDDGGTGTTPKDTLPEMSIADGSAEEGGTVELAVTLDKASDEAVTVEYRTVAGTALAGTDYTAATGTLTFAAGSRREVIAVATIEDQEGEADETFTVELSGASGATLGGSAGKGKIIDDDGGTGTEDTPIEVSIADAAVVEGGTAELAVTLSRASQGAVTVSYRTMDGTAQAGLDYTPIMGTLPFPVGSRLRVVRVPTRQDNLVEPDKTFTVVLSSATGATLRGRIGTGTIIDDDGETPPDLPRLDIADTTVLEGGTARFVVSLSALGATPVTVSYRTMDGTAEAGTDYTAASGMLQFDAGTTTRELSVETLTDERVEGDERFTVELSEAGGATVGDGTAVGKITDDLEQSLDPINRALLPEMGRALAFTSVRCRIDQAFSDLANGAVQPFVRLPALPAPAARGWAAAGAKPLPLAQALAGASFLVPSENGVTVWGCGDYRSLAGSGKDRAVAWNGEVISGQFGVEVRLDARGLAGWAGSRSGVSLGSGGFAGLSISQSRATFDYDAAGGNSGRNGGRYELQLTGVHPYLGWSISPDIHVWATVGAAWGKLGRTDDVIEDLRKNDAKLDSGAVGISARLLARGPTKLNLKGEAALAQLDVGRGGKAFGSGIDLGRLRLSLQASREYAFPAGGRLTPWGELGVRHDGGDGDTGAGVELGGGLRYRNSATGWTAEGHGRWLATHAGGLEREGGVRALLRFAPGAGGLGPSVTLGSISGDPASGVQRMWDRGAPDSLLNDTKARSLEARFAYGFGALRGGGVLTPYGVMSLDRGNGRGYRLGLRWATGRSATLNLEAERRERRTATDHGITARVAIGF